MPSIHNFLWLFFWEQEYSHVLCWLLHVYKIFTRVVRWERDAYLQFCATLGAQNCSIIVILIAGNGDKRKEAQTKNTARGFKVFLLAVFE